MKTLRKIAYPFSFLYDFITSIRNVLYDKHVFNSTKFETPVIVVGNLSVGGTGKTPQIEYLIRLLKADCKLAVLSRGYKRKSKGFIIADEKSNSDLIGDEPFQYYKKFENVIIAVDSDRTNGINQLENLNNPPDVVLLDDAFQHRKVEGGLNILLTPYNDLYIDDSLLPAGNLRENTSGAKRAQIIIVTKCPNSLSEVEQFQIAKKLKPTLYQTVFFTTISYSDEIKGSSKFLIKELKEKEVVLVTGIANPTPLLDYLHNMDVRFTHLKYPDHYNFNEDDLKTISEKFDAVVSKNKLLLTTEKDYVRIFDKIENLHYISIKTEFLNHSNDFNKIIKRYVEQSSRNS
ncbi:tetraacyldisaccharide 4'-kinase [uncultured Lutibacter sp.]|uniref:tetraacyldisaccharide 4'-kinase n=1 Tax=uncultured Lutibacter sp. TaxID=437739 RepID=UPI00262C8131|nr:tetraacyldisaccharide 4'-kinase [uncultured Lutibacter sp.]